MAKALQCPECGERHPLTDIAGTKTFRCRSCGRLLKIPAEAVAVTAAGGRGGGGGDPDATAAVPSTAAGGAGGAKVPPSQRGVDLSEARRRAPATVEAHPVGRSIRVIAWLVAIPAGLIPVLVVGRMTGLLTVDAAVDMFIGVGWTRFAPPLVVLPIWAVVTATVAHFLIETAARVLHRD